MLTPGWWSTDQRDSSGGPHGCEPDEGDPEPMPTSKPAAFDQGSPEHLLGDVLGYWRRKEVGSPASLRSGAVRDRLRRLLDDPEALAGLEPIGLIERHRANGSPITPVCGSGFPKPTDGSDAAGDQVIYATPDGPTGYSSVIDSTSTQTTSIWRGTSDRGAGRRPQRGGAQRLGLPKPEATGALRSRGPSAPRHPGQTARSLSRKRKMRSSAT